MSRPVFAGDGCGNAFLLVRGEDLREAGMDPAALARHACGERWDGVLVVGDEDAGRARAVRIVNRDGSDGGACLNGLRVVARWTRGDAGVLRMAGRRIRWTRAGEEDVELRLPVDASALPVERFRAGPAEAWRVSFWNPHAVVFTDEDPSAADLPALARAVAADAGRFPGGVNVELCRLRPAAAGGAPQLAEARVHERGVGETRACGSGAVALAAAAWRRGAQGPLAVCMRGGELLLQDRGEGEVALRGAARCGPAEDLEAILASARKPLSGRAL